MKKGIVFTLMTFMLLITVLSLSVVLTRNAERIRRNQMISHIGTKSAYLQDDLTHNILRDVYGFNLTMSDVLIIEGLVVGENYTQITNRYKEFVEQQYSTVNNVEISFGLEPDVNLSNCGELRLNTSAYLSGDFDSMNLTITIDNTDSTQNSTPASSGSTPISVTLIDNSGTVISESVNLDPSTQNSPFSAEYEGSKIEVFFGDYGTESTLIILPENLTAAVNAEVGCEVNKATMGKYSLRLPVQNTTVIREIELE